MRFEHDGMTYGLSFQHRDVPVLATVSQRLKLKADEQPPTRRETTARLVRYFDTPVGGVAVPPHEVMRATVRRYFKDEPWSKERARQQALKSTRASAAMGMPR